LFIQREAMQSSYLMKFELFEAVLWMRWSYCVLGMRWWYRVFGMRW
jgi:hypothetical protein